MLASAVPHRVVLESRSEVRTLADGDADVVEGGDGDDEDQEIEMRLDL